MRFNLPRGLEILTEQNKETLLKAKHCVPKNATIEFYGATSDIVEQLMTAWSNHVPEKIKLPER